MNAAATVPLTASGSLGVAGLLPEGKQGQLDSSLRERLILYGELSQVRGPLIPLARHMAEPITQNGHGRAETRS